MTSTLVSTSPVWHPFTQMKTAPAPLFVRQAKGAYLECEDGRRILDCISSWWVTLHGHAQPEIAAAIHEQAKKLEQVIFAGFTHEPAEMLARRALSHLPRSLSRVFYSDNGSTAVEVALKLAVQYWHNRGQERHKFIAFEGGYHGDTVGAMSVSKSPFLAPFKQMMFDVERVSFPFVSSEDPLIAEREKESLEQIESLVLRAQSPYAAIIVEPLLQAVCGMRMCRPQFLQELTKRARALGLLLIYDEAVTGFGRTGDWFACTKSQTAPDILCLAKGLSGGFLPLAMTLTTDAVFEAFLSDDMGKTFLHGHSYTANPLACAAGLASLDLLEKNPQVFQDVEVMNRMAADEHLAGQELVRNQRFLGTMTAFDLTTSDGSDYFDNIGPLLRQKFLERDLLIRPLGNTIYLTPPYCLTEAQRQLMFRTVREVLDRLL